LVALEILHHLVYLPIFWHSIIENQSDYDERTAIDNFQKSLLFFFLQNIVTMRINLKKEIMASHRV
jgi:hypothetical protein